MVSSGAGRELPQGEGGRDCGVVKTRLKGRGAGRRNGDHRAAFGQPRTMPIGSIIQTIVVGTQEE